MIAFLLYEFCFSTVALVIGPILYIRHFCGCSGVEVLERRDPVAQQALAVFNRTLNACPLRVAPGT